MQKVLLSTSSKIIKYQYNYSLQAINLFNNINIINNNNNNYYNNNTNTNIYNKHLSKKLFARANNKTKTTNTNTNTILNNLNTKEGNSIKIHPPKLKSESEETNEINEISSNKPLNNTSNTNTYTNSSTNSINISNISTISSQSELESLLKTNEYLKGIDIDSIDQVGLAAKEMQKHKNPKPKDALSKKDYTILYSSEEEEVSYDYYRKPQSNRLDYDFKKFNMSRRESFINELPKEMNKAAFKILSKHDTKEVRLWTRKYLLQYAQTHANEPPLDLSKLKEIKFGNADELNIKTRILNTEENNNLNNTEDNNHDSMNLQSKEAQINKELQSQTFYNLEEEELKKDKHKFSRGTETNHLLRINYSPQFAIAYLYARTPNTFSVLKSILSELIKREPTFKPSSILDYGAGLGSGILAALEIYTEKNIHKIAAVEPNKNMRKLGKYFTDRIFELQNKPIDIAWVDALTMLPGVGGLQRGKYDLIILSHVLQEIPTAKMRGLVIETLYNRLDENSIFIVVEPGTPKGFRFIHDLREVIRQKKYTYKEEVNIIAPCPHNKVCPMASQTNTWCHYSQFTRRFDKTVIPRKRLDRDMINEKYMYLVVKKGKHIRDTLENYEEEENLMNDYEKSYKFHRVVRPTIKNSGHAIVDMCTTKGTFERRIIAKSHGKVGGYKTARKAKWGDLWYIPEWLPNKYRKEKSKGRRLW